MSTTKAQELLSLAILAFQNKEFGDSAQLFTSAMESEDLDSFVTYINREMPEVAMHGLVPDSSNTLSPALASSDDLSSIVSEIEATFRSHSSLIDDEDEEIEVRACEEDYDEEGIESVSSKLEDTVVESSAPCHVGPIRFKGA